MNFEYFKEMSDVKKLYEYCKEAEEFVSYKPNISVTASRKAMEYIVKMIYESIAGDTYGLTVFDMISDYRFMDYINDNALINSIHYIRKMGNIAVHEGNMTKKDAIDVLEELYFLVGEFLINLGIVSDYPEFKEISQNEVISKKESVTETKVIVESEIVAKFAPKMRKVKFDVSHERDVEKNKKLYMFASLREAGWAIVNKKDQALPCAAGINMLLDDNDSVDYILYGRDNRPLAIIEYETTVKNLIEGRNRGIEKAKKLEIKFGYKPVIYYTNGYNIYCIDQLGYPARRVFQFHSIEELEWMKQRKTMRQDISNPVINDEITNRYYQKEAIKETCKALMDNKRHSLLVMATGTGKTRVAISLCDVLTKANWAKNILFLADRTSLVRQANKNFNKLLPSVTTAIYAGDSGVRDKNARIIFATYQTMINLINDDTREFGIGRFDLIIIDEAHRSIFNKYGLLFKYFDALTIGLTATPRSEDNKSTYEVFELEDGCPNYAYELEEAINDNYLVGYSVVDRTTKVLERGISYDDLSEEEKEQIEDAIEEGDLTVSTSKDGASIFVNSKVINTGTIDVMLNDIMKNGLKVDGGDKIGKTIIFAKSHVEAEIIVSRFQHIYSYLGMDFCKLIDSQVAESINLIDNFGERDKFPQIAVSVDMLDTGIDVPDVLNLVFFKYVKSKIKFMQMIGRGTRLSENIFGPGMDKEGFLIFDYYDNFNYFKVRNTWNVTTKDESKDKGEVKVLHHYTQSGSIYKNKLEVLSNLLGIDDLNEFDAKYKEELREFFLNTLRGLNNDDIGVQYDMPYVNKYRLEETWNDLSDEKIDEFKDKIIPLLPPIVGTQKIRAFDSLMYAIESKVPDVIKNGGSISSIRYGFTSIDEAMKRVMECLLRISNIPAINAKEELISKLCKSEYLIEDFSLEKCEYIRKELRDLVDYIEIKEIVVILNVEDEGSEKEETSFKEKQKSYKERANDYILNGSPELSKIRNLDELTLDETNKLNDIFKVELGTEAEYAIWSNNMSLLPFLRVQVGISDDAIKTKFGSILNDNTLNKEQLTYLEQIISYARENGDITFLDLQKVSPFCDFDVTDLFGEKISYIKLLINGLHKPVM